MPMPRIFRSCITVIEPKREPFLHPNLWLEVYRAATGELLGIMRDWDAFKGWLARQPVGSEWIIVTRCGGSLNSRIRCERTSTQIVVRSQKLRGVTSVRVTPLEN